MTKTWIFILAAIVLLYVLSLVAGNRIAAGGGALLLLGGLIYGYMRTRHEDPADVARTEATTRDLREQLNEEDTRGER